MTNQDVFSARRTLETGSGPVTYYDITSLEEQGIGTGVAAAVLDQGDA